MKHPILITSRFMSCIALFCISMSATAQQTVAEPQSTAMPTEEAPTSVTITVPSKEEPQPIAAYDWRAHRNSLNITIGAPSLYSTIAGEHPWTFNRISGSSTSPSRAEFFCGAYSLTYTYNILRWLAVGATGGYECWVERNSSSVYRTHDAFLMAVVNFTYLNHEHIKLYSGINAGFSLHLEISNKSSLNGFYLPAVSLTPIGIHLGGKHVYGIGEISIGAQSVFRAGIGAKF